MKYYLCLCFSFFFLILMFLGCISYPTIPKIEKTETYSNSIPQTTRDYLIRSDDILNVVIWDHNDLNRKAQVSREGDFSYPLIGKIKADGLTVSQLEKTITERLSGRYIINPQVTVTVEEYHRFFYVFGEVKNPGRYPLQVGTTVLKAITMAGGATEKAAINKVKMVREEEGIKKEINTKMTDYVNPEDLIIVPESFF